MSAPASRMVTRSKGKKSNRNLCTLVSVGFSPGTILDAKRFRETREN